MKRRPSISPSRYRDPLGSTRLWQTIVLCCSQTQRYVNKSTSKVVLVKYSTGQTYVKSGNNADHDASVWERIILYMLISNIILHTVAFLVSSPFNGLQLIKATIIFVQACFRNLFSKIIVMNHNSKAMTHFRHIFFFTFVRFKLFMRPLWVILSAREGINFFSSHVYLLFQTNCRFYQIKDVLPGWQHFSCFLSIYS